MKTPLRFQTLTYVTKGILTARYAFYLLDTMTNVIIQIPNLTASKRALCFLAVGIIVVIVCHVLVILALVDVVLYFRLQVFEPIDTKFPFDSAFFPIFL